MQLTSTSVAVVTGAASGLGEATTRRLVADGTVVTGDGESEIELTEDGRLRLVEHYEMHGLPQLSVCEELSAS